MQQKFCKFIGNVECGLNSSFKVSHLEKCRHVLKLAYVFPSIKRFGIVKEIQTEFRKNKTLTDPKEVDKALSIARKGITQLEMYTGLRNKPGSWAVQLDQEPIPKPPQSI